MYKWRQSQGEHDRIDYINMPLVGETTKANNQKKKKTKINNATKRGIMNQGLGYAMLLDIYVFTIDFPFWIASEARNKFRYWPESLFFSFGASLPALLRQSHTISPLHSHLSTYNELGSPA